MSGRKSKKSQKLASTRQSLNRKSNIGTQEKENYDGPPHSGNEDHECEKNKTDTLNEILPASLLLQAGGAATACTDQQNSSLEPSPYSQSQDCKDLLVPTEVASKKRKIGSTRKNNRGLKAAEQNEKEPRCRLEVSEENTEQHGVTEVVSVIEEGSKEEYGQPDLSDCSPSQFLKPERSTLQGEHLLLGSITHTEEAAENNMGHNLEITFQSQTMGLSCYDHDQSMKAALNQESISHSLDCRIVTPAESKLSHNDSLQMYNQMEMFSDQVKFLHNITDQKRKVDTAQTHLTGNEVEKNLSEELCPKKHFYEMANQYGIVFNEDSRNVENFQVSQDMQVIPSQSCTALNTMLEQSKLDFMCEVKGDKETKSTFISHDYSTEARGADTITTSLINEHQQQCSGTSENGFYSSIDGTKESHGTITLENISTAVETVDEDLVSSCLKHKGDTSKLTQDLESAYELKSTDCWEEKKECNNLCVVSDRVDSESNEVVEASYPTQPIQSDSIILPLEQEHQVGASLDKISYEIGFHCDSPDLEFKCHKDEQYDFSFARRLNGDSNLRENAEGRNLNKLNNDECCETKTEKKEVESNTMAFTSSSQLLISKICHTKKVSDVVDETTLIHAETLYEITNEELETSNKAHDVPYSDSQELPPELEMQSVEGDGVDLCSGSHRLPDNKLDQGTRLYAEVPFQSNHIIIDKDEMGGNYITNDKNHKLFEQIQSTENVYHSVLSRGKEEDSGDTTLAVDETFQLTKRYPGEVDILERTDISTEHGRLLVYGSVDCVSEDRVNHEKRAQTTGQIIKQADDFQLSLADELQRQGTCFEEGMRYESHGEHERQEAKIFQSLSPMVKDKIVESDAGLIGHDYGAPEKDNIPQKSVVCVEVTDVLMTNSAKQEDNKTSITLFVSKDEETEDIVSSNPEYEFLDTKNKAMEMNSKTYRGIDTASTILPDMEELQIHKTQNKSELEEITVQKDELVDKEKDGEPLSLLDNFLNISHNSKLEEFKASEWTEIVTVTKDADHISTSIGHMGIKEVEPNEIISQDEDRNLYEEEKDVSLTDRSNGELKDVTKECGKIDTQPVILLDVVQQSEPVVFVGVSQTEAPLESTKHRESMIDDKQDYELTSSNEQKMAPVIRDIQNDLTDHSSPHKTSMTVEDCESTENESPKKVDDSPICATIEHIYEIQDSVITPVNKEITLEVLSDQVTQLPWDDKEKGKRGVEDEDGDVCQEEKNMPLSDIYGLSSTTNEFSKDDKNEVKEEIKAGSTEYSTREDFTLVCSKQYMHSELFSQTNEQNVSTKTPPSTVLENSDSTGDDRNREENTEVRNTELCAKIQTKKKKRFGSTRRLQGEHQQGSERKERQWQKVEDTEGTEHDREERCSEEITNLEPTHHLFTEPHSVESKVSLDQSLTTEREEGKLKDVTGECGKIDTPPVHLLDVVHQSEPVVFDGVSQAKAPLESTKHGESVIDDEQDYEFTSSNEQKMAPVIRDIQNDFTDHASPQEASMTVEDCDSESTENGSSKQVDGSPICATIEHICEIQDSVIMPVNKEITLEVLSDQVTQLPWDDNSDEDHLVQTTSRELETEPPENTCPVIHIQDLKSTMCNETEVLKMQNISGEMVETAMKKKEPAVEKQKNDEHISLEDPLHSSPDPKLGELKASKCAELFTDTTDTDHILTSVEQAEVADDDQLTEPKEFLGHVPSTPFQEYANIQINAAGHRRKMGSLRTFEGKRGVEDEDGDVCQEEKNMPLADIYDLSSTTNEFSKDDKNEVKEEIKAGSTEYSTREDFSLVCSKQYMHSELFSQTNEQNVSTKTPPSTVLENSDSTEDDRNRKENTEVRNTELCAKIQTKKKKRFGSTRRLQGEHQQGRERKERQWQKVEDTEGTEHDREERCSEEITNLEPTHHLFTEPHSVERKVSLDQSLTTEREEGELKDVTGECGKIDTPPVHLLDVVHQSEPVVFDGVSQAKAPLESTKHGESVIDDEQDYEFTSSNEQKMAPVIRDIQNDFTDHASPQEASMTVEDCDSESTENGSSKQVDGSPICATIEHIYEIQDSVIMPVNKEITLEVLSDQVTQLPWDDSSDEDHLVQTTSRELETEPPENTCPVIHIQDLKSTMCNETEVLKMQNISGEMVETAMKKKEPAVEKQKNDEHISLEDPLHSPPDPKLGELKASKCAELFTDTTDTDHILTSVEQAEVADDDQLTEPKEFLGHVPSTPFQEYANIQINAAGHRRKMGSLRTFEGKRGVEDEDGDVCQEEKNMPLADIYDLSSTTNEFSKDDKNEVKEEIKAGSTEYSTREDFSLVCSKQYMHSELFSQTNEQNVSTKTPPSTVLENSDSTEDDRNRKENTEVRNTELCAKIQTKKKKRFGSTRRLQGEHQQGRERKERQWQKVEDTEGTEHDREERCSEEITNLEPTHHLFTEPHSVERKVSLDQSLTTEREEGELKDVTGECGKIDTPPVHLLDVVHQSEPVVFDGVSQAKAPLESTKHGESVIDDEQDYEFTSSNEQKMAPVIRDIQNDFTDHASPQEASMTVEDCDSESTENGSSKQVDGSPICATIEHIYEIQDSVIMPVNKEITLEVLSDQVTQLPWDDSSDEDHLVQTTSRELETEPPENTCPVIHIQDLKSTMCNETEVLKMQNISGEMVETAMKKKEPAVEKQKNDEHISLEDPLHSPPDPKLGELKASKCAELFTDTTDTDHILTSVEQAEVADDDQLTEPKEFLGHVPSTPFQEYANIQINAAGHRRKMGSLRTFEGKRGVEDEDGDVCQEEKNMPLADIYDLSSTTNEFSKDDKNEVKEEIKAGSTEYSTREDFSLVCSKQYMHSELFSQTNEQNVSTKTPPSTVLENSDSTEDDRNRKENTEVRNTELCAKIQTKKKKRFGSTRRLQGEHQQGRERKERQWQKVEDTEGTEHDREERCSEEIINLEPTHHLFTEPHSVERKVSLDQSLTTEREEGELKDVTGECGKIDTPPVHLLDVVHQSEPVVFDGVSQAKAPLESTKHGESVIDDEQDYEFTSSNEQKMAPVIRDIQNDFTDHASPQEASMTVEDCDSESTENGSSKQVDGSPICATIEHIYEIQDSVIIPVNKEITLEVLSDQVTQLPWDDSSDEDHLVQTTSRELETEPPENTCPVIHIQDLKSTMCNETEVLKMQNISGEMVETAMKKKEPAVEKQKNDEHISLEDPLHSPPDPKLGELKASKCAELFTDTTDTDHILTSVEQAEVADDDQLTEPKEFLGHVPSTPFQEYANIQINAAGHRRKMGSLRTFEGKRGVEDEDGDVCQQEKNMPLADIYDLSSTTNEFSKDDKNEVKEEIKAGSTEYSTREDFSLVCSKQYMHSELFSQTNEQNVSTKTPPSTVLENSDSTEDDRNRKENTEVRNTELCAKIQTKKKKRFGSTRRLQGEHQQGRERKERQWQKVEDTEGTEHDREERCSEEITNLEPTHHLFTEPHSVERKVSLDQSLTTEREEGELKDVTGECGKIDTPPVHLLDVVHQSEPVVFDGVSQAKAPLESTKHGESVIDDEQDYEFTSSNEQKMAPVIRDIQNDFTDHASPQEASMTVEDCDSESTENGSSKQVDGSPICATIEHIYEIQDSVIMPVNKEITLEVLSDQVTQLPWDDSSDEDHLVQTTSRELETEPPENTCPVIHIQDLKSTMCNETEVLKMQNISGEMVETAMKKKEPAVEKQKNDEHISLEDPLHSPPDPKLGELKASKCAELFTDTTDTDHILTSVEQAEVADDDQLTEPKEFLGHVPSTPFQEYANIQINAAGHRRKMGSLRTFEGKRGVEDEDGDVCQEEKNMPLADIYDLSSTTNEFSKDDKNEVKEEIKAGSTEYSTREDFSLVCSKQYMHSELFSQTNEQNVSTKTPPSTVLENSDSTEDDRNRKENTEVRNTELCAKIQTKKKKRFGSTRRLQGEHQQGRERKERQWQKVEDTEGTEHDREERCSEEITNLEPTHHLFTEPHSVERKVSLDQSLTTEREEGELKDVTGECGKIDTPPVHLLDVVHQSEPVVFDGVSQAKAPLESTKHGESVIDDEQDYEFTSSNEQKMAPVIRDIQNDFTDHASPQEASMTVEDCDSESTENGSSKQVDGSPICATIEHIYEIQDSVIMPVNKEITLEVLSDQVTQLPWDDSSDEDHLVQTTSRELETEPPENTCPVIHIQDLKSTMCNETEVLKMQNISGEMVETAMKKKEPAVEKQKNDEHISLEDPLHSPPDPKLGELKASKCAELFTDTTDTDHILTSVEQAEVADDDQLTEPKEFLGHVPSTPFQEYANIQINAAGHRRKMGSLRTFEGKRGVEDEDGDVCQEEKNMPLADIYDLSSTTNEFSKDDKNEVKEEIKAGSTEYSTREDFSLVCSKQYMHSELFSQTNEQNVSTKTPPSTVLENSDSTEDDRNRKENTEVRNTELCAKIQTKKKKRFGSTRRLQGEHQQGRERKERQWQKVEDTEGTEHDREERCSEEITNLEPTHHLFTEPHSVERKVSLDQSLTTEREEGELKDVTGECGKIDTPPVHLLDVVHQSEPVVFDGVSQAKAPLESTKHGESVIDDEQDYEFTSSNEQKMAPVIRDIQNDFTDHASPQEASMTVEDCDSESTENETSKQVDGSPSCTTIEHNDQVRQLHWDDNLVEDHLEHTTSRELGTEPLDSIYPEIHIKFSISTQDKVISEKSNSEKRRKMGSTRRSLRGQLPESDQTCTIQGIKEEENIKQQKIDQCTPVTGKDNLQVITSVFIPTSSSESSSQSRDHHSNPSNQVIEKIDKKKRKMGSTRKNLLGVENKKPIMERMKDINPKDDEDIAREEAKSAINYGIVNTVSGLHDAACGCSEVDATEQDNQPQLCEKPNQLEGSLLSEIEYELKKGSSLNSLLETYDNQQNIFGNSDPVAEQSQSTLQIPASLKILSQAYTEPASPVRKRKMGSTRKTSRNKHIEETGDKKRETEQDIVTPKISEDTKESAKDVLVPTDDLTVCKPCLISEPGSLPNSHAVSDPSRMETSPSNEQGIKPFVKEVDVSTEDGLVSLDDIRKFALYDGSSGKRVKIDFEEWNKQVPDFGVAVYNVVIVGNCNVGKTSFIKRFQSGHFSPEFYSTVGVDTFVQTITLGNRTIKMSVWDTAGQERYHSITTQLFHKAQGLLLMYDITCSQSFIAVRDWISQIQERAPADVIIMLLGNKKDCADRKVQLREGEDLSREYKINFMECSAATGENVSESMKALAWLLVKQRVRKEEEQTILQQKQPQKKSGCC